MPWHVPTAMRASSKMMGDRRDVPVAETKEAAPEDFWSSLFGGGLLMTAVSSRVCRL